MINRLTKLIRHWVLAFIYPRPFVGILYLPRFLFHWFKYSRSSPVEKINALDLQPCLGDWSTHTPFDAHYFYQGAWLARKISELQNEKHVDIGSSVLTISVLSAFIETTFVDYRPIKVTLPGLTSIAGDILDLPFDDETVESLSCLHVIEHIGLGRYGDPLDSSGSVKAAFELQRVVKVGGKLFLSLPIGRERVCYNAHRVHSPSLVLNMFKKMHLIEFSYVDDNGCFHSNTAIESVNSLEYGCGMFLFEKQ